MKWNRDLAEDVRFELTEALRLRRFSRPVHSTALPILRSDIVAEIAYAQPGTNPVRSCLSRDTVN